MPSLLQTASVKITRKKKKPAWKYILFMLVILFFLLALLEGMARILVFYYKDLPMEKKRTIYHDTTLHHAWVPSKTSIDKNRSIPYPLIINKQGWVEQYDVAVEKPKDTYRIFYLGDSNTQGVVAPEYKMVELVEKMLNEKYSGSGMKFEVINTGTSSYSCMQYYLLSKRIMKYSPDLVVLDIDMTDVPNDFLYRQTAVKDENGDYIAVKPDVSSKYIMTPHGFVKYQNGSGFMFSLSKYSDFMFFVDRFVSEYLCKKVTDDESADWLAHKWTDKIEKNVNESMKIIAMNVEFLRKNNVRIMITGVPYYNQYTGFFSDKPHEVLQETAAKLKVPFLNSYLILKNKIKGTSQTDYYWDNDDSHFNIAGNKLWAQAQFEFICNPANNLLPFDRLNKKTAN